MQSVSEEGGKPVVLAEGLFGFDAALDIGREQTSPVLDEDAAVLRTGCLQVSGEAEVTAVHLLLPEDEDPELTKVWIRSGDGIWREVSHKIVGSYAVFEWSAEDVSVALVREEAQFTMAYYAAAAGVLLLTVIIVVLAVRSRKRKRIAEK